MSKKNSDNLCQYMTPPEICKMTLDKAGYQGYGIAETKVLEPSFGTGNFLVEILARVHSIISETTKLKEVIQNNIFGIEKDQELYCQTIERLNEILQGYGIDNFDWSKNLYCTNALTKYKDFIGTIDLVVGNPPFVRIHNCTKEERTLLGNFELCKGNTDLYIAFYELSYNCLSNNGKIALITPYTFLKTTAQKDFRNWIYQNNLFEYMIQFGEKDLWNNITTYPCLCVLSKTPRDQIGYEKWNKNILIFKETLTREQFNNYIATKPVWSLNTKEKVEGLHNIYNRETKLKDIAIIKEGLCTNANSIYVHRVWDSRNQDYKGLPTDERQIVYLDKPYPDGIPVESDILHRGIKATTYTGYVQGTYIIYPYDNDKLIEEKELKEKYQLAYNYLESQKEKLLKRDLRNNSVWYEFGRSQGLNQIGKEKIVFKQVFKEGAKIKAYKVPKDIVLYNGSWVSLKENHKNQGYDLQKIIDSEDFTQFCEMTGRIKQGGYIEIKNKQIGEFGIDKLD